MHKAAFLGPKGENAVEFERLLLEVLHDHVFWRRNFHPGDRRLIEERDKRTEQYGQMVARLRDELFQILAELKQGAPLYSPRQIAHMVSDPTLPALVGYFAGMLYNQNNVVAEAAPETVRKERAYCAALARMIGYPAFLPETLPGGGPRRAYAWGHLCSGGTGANLEALWIARNVRFYPLAVRLLSATDDRFAHLAELEVGTAAGEAARLADLPTAALLNLPSAASADLYGAVQAVLRERGPATSAAFREAVPNVRRLGLAGFVRAYNDHFAADPCGLPRVLISQAAHYGWAKGMDVVGLGAASLLPVPVDERVRVDVGALEETLHASALAGEPVLMVVSICGTTEEGAVDPLHRIEALRERAAGDGLSFWHHSDAAFGGYFAAMVPRDDAGAALPPEDPAALGLAGDDGLLGEDVYRALAALARTDSVTIDPHKFGYVPYPAGAVLFRDYRMRDAISYAAPYLATDAVAGFSGFLGQWTLEGSRPGAAAVSCYLSQATVPLTPEGHGRLMANCVDVTKTLVSALKARFAEEAGWVALRPFAEPDTAGFCFALVPREGARSVEQLNAFTHRLWQHLTVDGREDVGAYGFLLSKTEVDVASYRPHVERIAGPAAAAEGGTLMLLRLIAMNPFLKDWADQEPGFTQLFCADLRDVAAHVYPEHVLKMFQRRNGGRRARVLVVEPDPDAPASLTNRLRDALPYAAYLHVEGRAPSEAGKPASEAPHKVVFAPGIDDAEDVRRRVLEAAGAGPDDIVEAAADGNAAAAAVLMRRICEGLPFERPGGS